MRPPASTKSDCVLEVGDVGEAFRAEEFFGDVGRRLAHRRAVGEPDSLRLGRRLGARRSLRVSQQDCGPDAGGTLEEASTRNHYFSSLPQRTFLRCCASAASGAARLTLTTHDLEEPARIHYSITWSARSSRDGGIVRPSALAVLRLITSS